MTEGDGPVKRLWTAQQRQFALWIPVMIGIGVWIRLELDWGIPASAALFVFCSGCVVCIRSRLKGFEFNALASATIVFITLGVLAGGGFKREVQHEH